MSINNDRPSTCGYTCSVQCIDIDHDTTKIIGVIVRSNDGQSNPPISPPLNSGREVVPQEPPNGRWFIYTIYLI